MKKLLLVLALVAGCSGLTAAPGEAGLLSTQAQEMVTFAASTQPVEHIGPASAVARAVYNTCGPTWPWLTGKAKLLTSNFPYVAYLDAYVVDAAQDANLTDADATIVIGIAATCMECFVADVAGVPIQTSPPAAMLAGAKAAAPRKYGSVPLPAWVQNEIGKLPASGQAAVGSWVALYGEQFVAMGLDAVRAAFSDIVNGDRRTAYAAVLGQMNRAEKNADMAAKVQMLQSRVNQDAAKKQEMRNGLEGAFATFITIIFSVFGL